MKDDNNQTLQSFNRRSDENIFKTDTISAFGGILFGILVILTTILILNYFNIILLPSFFSFLPHKKPTLPSSQQTFTLPSQNQEGELNTKGCAFTKKGNPLVLNIFSLPKVITGTIIGVVDDISDTSITLHSLDKKQTNTFSITKTILVYSKTDSKSLAFSEVKPGKTVLLQFNCSQTKGNVFTIADIGIIN